MPAVLRLRLSLQQAAIICDPNDNGASLVWSFKEEARVAMPVAFCQLGPLPKRVVAVVFVGRSSREGDLLEENARALRRGWAMAQAAAPTLYEITEDKIYVLNLGRSIALPRPGNDAGANANERQVQALIAVSHAQEILNQEQVDLAVRDAVRNWRGSNVDGTCELWKYDSQADRPRAQARRSC